MTPPPLSLADLVGDVERFGAEHWGRAPLLRATGRDLTELLDVAGAEGLLVASARRPAFRLVDGGERLPPERSTSPVRMGGTTLDDVADVAKVADALDAGATLVLQGLQRIWPPLIDLCRRLEQELHHPVQANAYLTPANGRGLARHADEHVVIVLQAVGRKAWDVAGLGGVTLDTGDALYLPAGTEHAAAAQDEPSLHITVGILRVTYRQVVRRLLDRLDERGLRTPLPIGFASPERTDGMLAGVTEQLQALARALASTDPHDVVEHEQRRARTQRRPLGTGRIQSVLAVHHLEPSSLVEPASDHPAHLADDAPAGRTRLVLLDRTVELPVEARPAIEHLLRAASRREPVKVSELPDLSDASRVVVARRLVREGWLRVVQT